MSTGGCEARVTRQMALVLVVLTLALYAPVGGFEFINFDDDLYVTGNARVQAGLTWEGVAWAFTNVEARNWHPATWLSHMLDFTLFGMSAGGHHVVNVFFHAANTVLLFLLLSRVTARRGRSMLVAALFAWHPMHVESVAWVAERKDVLSGFFFLLTLWAYLRYAAQPGWKRYGWLAVAFLLGLMSKPMLVTVPCVLMLLDIWPLRRWRPKAQSGEATDSGEGAFEPKSLGALCWEKLPLLALSVAVCGVTVHAQSAGGAMQTLGNLPLVERLANAVVACGGYLSKSFLPDDLAIFYPMPAEYPGWLVVASGVLLAAITLLAARTIRRAPYLAVGWFWFVGMLVPVIGLVQVGEQAMADRYMYLPQIGLFLAAAWGVGDVAERWGARELSVRTATAGVLLACLVLTHAQLRHWRNSETVFRQALAATRENSVAHNALGAALASAGRSDEAMAEFREAVRITPEHVRARSNLAYEHLRRGEEEQAANELREVLRLRPEDWWARHNLAQVLAQLRKFDDAIREFEAVLREHPGHAVAHMNLAWALAEHGKVAAAVPHLETAMRLRPDWAEGWSRFARVLLMSPDPALRGGPRPTQLATRACELSGYADPNHLGVLAAALAEADRFEEAAHRTRQALDLARQRGLGQMATQLETRLASYQQGKRPATP